MIGPMRRLKSAAIPNPLTSVRRRKAFLVCRATVVGLLAWVSFNATPAKAAIIQDTFTDPDNTALIGRLASPTDTPGNPYSGNGNVSLVGGPTAGTPYEADIQNNAARVGGDAGLGINLGIATATQFQLAITFNINADTETQADSPFRGAGLGFYSSMTVASGGSSHGFNNFTGLAVDKAGSVRLIVGGTNSGVFTIVGGFDPSINHTLSYIVNTASGVGSISSILLDGSSVSLTAPINTFTIARAAYAGFYNSSGTTQLADFPDFYVAVVPESSCAMWAVMVACCASVASVSRLRRVTKTRSRPGHS